MIGFDPAFRLIDAAGVRAASELTPAGPVVDVAVQGAAGVISALTGAQGDVVLVRDAAMNLPERSPSGLWLQTSGTTGPPKWVGHDPETLLDRVSGGREKARWLLTYHPASFAGLQVILSALKGGHDLVVPPLGGGIAEMAEWAVTHQVTHISGTPTFWRSFVMALSEELPLRAVTLGGEMADQAILDTLRTKFPQSLIRHIYATTETGVVFSINDGREGFPSVWLETDSRLSLSSNDTLCINGIDMGDVIEIDSDRALFRGRLDNVINIGGTKIFPEAIESYLLRLTDIHDARVSARPSPITGHVLVAELIAKVGAANIEQAVKDHLSQLPRIQRPALVRYVTELTTTEAGKKARTP